MMKKTLLVLLTAVLAAACGTKGYVVKGDVQGLDGKVYLALMQGKTPQIIDSTTVEAGKFEFKGELQQPMLAQIQTSDLKTVVMFYLENSPEILINGNMEQKEDITVSGSAEDALGKQFAEQIKNAKENRNEVMDGIFAANPKSVAAAYIFFRQRVPSLTFTEMREGIAKFDSTLQNIVYLQQVAERANTLERVDIGKPFVDFELADTTRTNMVKLSDVAGKGQYVLLDFWAGWCNPCRRENPNVVANYKKYSDKGFTVFGVSLDKTEEQWKDAIAKDGLNNWTNVSDIAFWDCAPAKLYGVGSIPSNVLIDPQGIIIARNVREEALGQVLDSLLGGKKDLKKK